MTKIRLSRLAAIWLGLSLPMVGAWAQETAAPPASIKLSRVVIALPVGATWLNVGVTSLGFCVAHGAAHEVWSAGRRNEDVSVYQPSFKEELGKAGFKVVTPGEDNLFEESSGSPDYEAAAVITDADLDACLSQDIFHPAGTISGSGTMKIDWQIYSPIKKQVVARISTSAQAKTDKAPGGLQRLLAASFASNARELASSAEFRAALTAPVSVAKDVLAPAKQDKIMLAGSLQAVKRPIADTVGSVVTILASAGSGSGDLVSSDGYILTNAHVVEADKQVRVRWSDGIETVADVVRVSKTRDVALIKTSSRDREPLAIKRGAVTPGQRVYAIGSPLGKELAGTVSAGIISATRTVEGMRMIQSDVAITHGSSGGALLDENGSMIGIAVSGVEKGGSLNINFFIPVGDALDFLNLEPH